MGNPLFEEFQKLFESKEEFKISSPYMINRLLSLSQEGFIISTIANQFAGRIPKKLFYLIIKKYIGTKRVPNIAYPKKTKQEDILLSKVCLTFNCNPKHGKQIIKLYRNLKYKPEEFFGIKEQK